MQFSTFINVLCVLDKTGISAVGIIDIDVIGNELEIGGSHVGCFM